MGAIDRPKKRSGRHAVRLRRDGISAGIQTQETADFVTTLNVPRNFVRRFAVGVTRQNLNRLGASMKLKQYLGPEDIQAGPERAMENPLKGLTSDEARRRLGQFGPNATPDVAIHPLRLNGHRQAVLACPFCANFGSRHLIRSPRRRCGYKASCSRRSNKRTAPPIAFSDLSGM
jgi:hypothetical protein